MPTTFTPRTAALTVGLTYLALLVGAWIFEYLGYAPCELCLMQRWAYYAIIPAALLVGALTPSWIRPALAVIGLALVANAVFGVYHAGVEWKWWLGPSTCGAGAGLSGGLPNLSQGAVLCTEAAIRILGLSLAGWNALFSGALALVAFAGVVRKA
jgi:disulfide bond formation protein DsbB